MAEILEPTNITAFRIKPSESDSVLPGCYLVEFEFDSTTASTLQSISFTNDYAEHISGHLFFRNLVKSEKVDSVQILRRCLMPQPFRDVSSRIDVKVDLPEDFPTVNKPKYIQRIRFLLQQSNPHWSNFGINNVVFHGSMKPIPVQSSEGVPNVFKLCRRFCRNGDSVCPLTK